MCSLAPSLAACSPHLPRPATSMCPSCVSARPAVFFFLLVLLAAPARPACALCSSSCYPGPAPLRPPARLSPLPFSFSLSTLPARLPSLSVQRCHLCVPLACPTPAPPPRPYPFPWVLPRSPPLIASWLPGALCEGGGVGVSVVWTVALYPPCAPSQQGVEVRNAGHCAAVAPVGGAGGSALPTCCPGASTHAWGA